VTRAIKAHLGDFVALIVLIVIGIGVSAYVLVNQDSRPQFPWEATPFTLKGEFSTAQAVTPGQGQSIRVAGVQVGKIQQVELKNGVAVVTTQIDAKWVKKLGLRSDATMLLRPRTGLKDMFIELDPGGSGHLLKSGATIPVSNTAPDVNPDEFLSSLDADTRQYLELLINGGGKGLANHGNDLNALFKVLTPTNQDLKRLTQAIAQRRADLKQLVTRYADLTNTLANSDTQIHTLVNASDAVFRAFASQNQNIAAAVSKLPSTLQTTTATLTKVKTFAPLLRDTLCCSNHSLTPAFRQLNATNQQVLPFMRAALHPTRDQIRPFVRRARPYVRQLRPASINLSKATPDLDATFHELNRFFNELAYNPGGRQPVTGGPADKSRDEGYLYWLAWVAHDGDSVFSTSDAQGPFRRFYFGLDCTEIRLIAAVQPQFALLSGLLNALNDPGLCPSAGPSPVPIPNPLPGIIPLSRGPNKSGSAPKQATPAPGQTSTTPTQTSTTPSPLPSVPGLSAGAAAGGTPTTPKLPAPNAKLPSATSAITGGGR
jgi:phospholipid/cholesterol/gamma-HCH transport system substrate-binding protein